MDDIDAIWNRALAMDFEPHLPGDSALQAMLWFHNLTMSGGVLHAIEQRDDDSMNIIEVGYRRFGLEGVAELIASTRREIGSGALDDDGRAEALELGSDDRYGQLIPSDAVMEDAVRRNVELNRHDYE